MTWKFICISFLLLFCVHLGKKACLNFFLSPGPVGSGPKTVICQAISAISQDTSLKIESKPKITKQKLIFHKKILSDGCGPMGCKCKWANKPKMAVGQRAKNGYGNFGP